MPLIPCPACEHSISDQAPFCPRCGHPLKSDAPAAAPPPAPALPATLPAPTIPEPADPFRCVCGVWNREGAQRCASCGRALGVVVGRRPVQYIHTAPLAPPPLRLPEGERQAADSAAETLATISLVCAVVALFVWALVFGLIALACGIPAYLRGAKRGLAGVIIAIAAIGGWLVMLLLL